MTDLFVRRVTSAAMTNVKIDWGDWEVSDVFPRSGDLPDLYVDRPAMLVGKFTSRGGRADRPPLPGVSISGRVGDERVTIPAWRCEVPARARHGADGSAGATTMPALAQVWARTKIQSLDDRASTSGSGAKASEDSWNSKRDEIRRVALNFGLVSAYTSFVAVDTMDRTDRDDGRGVTVSVPSEVPRGTRYDTTVER
jgi:Ca-activated chloride channel family protein